VYRTPYRSLNCPQPNSLLRRGLEGVFLSSYVQQHAGAEKNMYP
jgi:hypothetical protein